MLHVVSSENRALYEREIEEFYRLRKAVFVDELGWNIPVRDGLEIDQYDDERAVYGFSFDYEHKLTMACRYRPTDDRSLLTDVFSHAMAPESGDPTGPGVWEITRGICLETGGARHNQRRRACQMLTPLELARAAGGTKCVAFAEVRLLPGLITMGWRVNLLGDPTEFGQGTGIAFEVDASDVAIAKIRRDFDLPEHSHIRLMPDASDQRSIHERAAALALQSSLTASLQPREKDLREVTQNAMRTIANPKLNKRAFDYIRRNQAETLSATA
ncbi:putative autoinducer synthesis protein [Sphingomonas changbaiensis NBRC 104936]|uniref:Acyl-homoserine-lactone synthase n=1 Tax=Sphingomonas changbaiensis NBRC 104936 TaxID=1219043 RepID=A0A0E9MPL1_9SPHN|nr:acyl-homoserine-lactone synthase [Sphingomonas changbaiensis]GAO39484.1 putative autoinducer synthesis protein [Sphingomonas changbaiensis NBRC 104936]